jgi:hypothetical protein
LVDVSQEYLTKQKCEIDKKNKKETKWKYTYCQETKSFILQRDL